MNALCSCGRPRPRGEFCPVCYPEIAGPPETRFPEPVTVTTERAAEIAAQFLDKAAAELRSGDYSHASVWIDSARTWLPTP